MAAASASDVPSRELCVVCGLLPCYTLAACDGQGTGPQTRTLLSTQFKQVR
jgi:hypothetical protein